ncbi:hypothetical protein E2C01_019266 [Portunus trituberculatus]|uniref:Uncharacterized protein n=1 Tax=Portunus trituberculatus TaxID=210409 RepID=A0A5B7DXT4_PORTR|nr:hypothetical protein [Portunus trituberculatus]
MEVRRLMARVFTISIPTKFLKLYKITNIVARMNMETRHGTKGLTI